MECQPTVDMRINGAVMELRRSVCVRKSGSGSVIAGLLSTKCSVACSATREAVGVAVDRPGCGLVELGCHSSGVARSCSSFGAQLVAASVKECIPVLR